MNITLGEEKVTTFTQAVERVSALAHARLPKELHGALERATALVKSGHVFPTDDGKHAQVLSSDGTRWYPVNGHCTCMDATRAPQGYCKHTLAMMLYRRASELLTTSGARPQPTNAAPPCPEALFSACLRGTVRGIDTQLTARGMTLEEFQHNFEAVHALFDPITNNRPKEPEETQDEPLCKYHGKMKASTKAPGTFYCTRKLADGSYCPSRFPER